MSAETSERITAETETVASVAVGRILTGLEAGQHHISTEGNSNHPLSIPLLSVVSVTHGTILKHQTENSKGK